MDTNCEELMKESKQNSINRINEFKKKYNISEELSKELEELKRKYLD